MPTDIADINNKSNIIFENLKKRRRCASSVYYLIASNFYKSTPSSVFSLKYYFSSSTIRLTADLFSRIYLKNSFNRCKATRKNKSYIDVAGAGAVAEIKV